MMMKSLLCVLVLFGALSLSLAKKCPEKCCCLNGGTNVTDANNCCSCLCPAEFSGDYCEKRSWRKVIAKWVYGGGSNQYWHLLQSSNVTDQPDRKALERKRGHLDNFDNFVTFKNGDNNPVLTLQFRGPGKKELHFLRGQFWTARANQSVTVTAYNGAVTVQTEQINLPLAKTYHNWSITFNKFVTRVEFVFSGPCDCDRCYGINYMYGEYTLWIEDDLTCKDVPCPDNATALFQHGCCNCPVVCKNRLDLMLILDRSGSIRSQYSMLKQVAKDIIRRFDVDANATHIGAVLYNHDASVRFSLGQYSTFPQYETDIDGFPGAGGGTDIKEALEDAGAHLQANSRSAVPNACMLLTDGISATNPTGAATDLKKLCRLVTIGVGSNINANLLTTIATNGQYIHSADVAGLEMVLDDLVTLLCDSKTMM